VGRPDDETHRISEGTRKAAKERLGEVVSGEGATVAQVGTPPASSESDLARGTRVGEYEVEEVIGRGGFGTVYRAVQPLIGKRVAIKVLSRKYSADGEIVSRFVAEARAVNQIRHRHIIDIFSFGQLPDSRHYYVMEHLDGEPLDRYLAERGAMSVPEALPILRAIARALDAAHAKGIAHRDLKPENIFIARDADGELYPKLLDFGIAKLMGSEESLAHKTGTGVPIGTPYYMSPEQCRGRDVDHRTDIYSFGVLTYRLLTGTYPFDGDVIDILHKQIHTPADPPSTRNPALSHEADQAVSWMMQKDPELRPRTVIAAVVALQDDKTPTPMLTPVRVRSALEARVASSLPAKRRWLVPAIGVLFVAGGLATFFAMRPAPPAPPPVVVKEAVAVPAIDAAAPIAELDAAPAHVTVRIERAPDGTQVMLAGAVVGVTPTPIQLRRGAEPVTLVFQADGHHPDSKQITPDRDQTLDVRLKKKPRATTTPKANGDALADPFKR
jgi:tRNA A-37 threonylcarbamoyl transferase component Bud32